MNGITHKQARRYMLANLDGLLTDSRRRDLETHLRECEVCRAEAESFSTLTARLQSGFHARWDPQYGPSDDVMANIHSQTRRIKMTNRINLGLRVLAGIAALLVLGFVINSILPQMRETSIAANGSESVNRLTQLDNRLIAFASEQGENLDIYTMRVDGSGLTNLTNNSARDTNPFWSPDGKHIAFESDRIGFTQIYLMDANGSNLIQLTSDKTDHRLPLNIDGKTNPWSPDGSKLLFLQQEPGKETWILCSVDINGTNKTVLASGNIQFNNISWSPDGTYIGYMVNDSPTPRETFVPNIYVADPDGGHALAINDLIPQDESVDGPFYWARDGYSIVFIAYKHIDEGKDQWIAYEADLAGSNLIKRATSSTPMYDWWNGTSFITGIGNNSPFTWLRSDGTYSTFKPFDKCNTSDGLQNLNRRSSNGVLMIGVGCNNEWWFYWVSPDGSVLKQLLDSPVYGMLGDLGNISWSPDERYIAFVFTASNEASLYVLNVDDALKNPSDRAKQVVIGNDPSYAIPSWQPIP